MGKELHLVKLSTTVKTPTVDLPIEITVEGRVEPRGYDSYDLLRTFEEVIKRVFFFLEDMEKRGKDQNEIDRDAVVGV